MLKYSDKQIIITDCKIIYTNFEGREDQYNKNGNRTFDILLENEDADILAKEGYNIKYPLNEEGERDYERSPRLRASVSYKLYEPKVYIINGEQKTKLTEETVGTLDNVDIEYCDIVLTPYHWESNFGKGIKPYLKSLYAVIEFDPFIDKYGV